MPIYPYRCPECGCETEEIHAVTEQLETCPECGAKPERVITQAAVHFKGDGWYCTDYGKKTRRDG